ncbi:MAG TPA: 23S rRNA (pseudouridine(1915)-N(3))-methyltransferase RlmH [Steroidobacteraceae bacterium]|nr:23S rRNA (pseudouridine(1915)-N(3))-methyltransferase RlmH [Steroidobacteraceae bacterium]
MRLKIVAAGTRLPGWVGEGFEDYARRIRGEFRLELIEVALGHRGSADAARAVRKEGERMLGALADRDYVVALQVGGRALSTEDLARLVGGRQRDGRDLAFCIGGPDGLDAAVDARADLCWSVSALTLPHGLVRVVVAEALYRAITVLRGHPYHRA